jgi:hypothetical protein
VLDDLYLGVDGAITVYRLDTTESIVTGPGELVTKALYAVEDDSFGARFYSFEWWSEEVYEPVLGHYEEMYDRYLDAWAGSDRAAFDTVYARDAVVRDAIDGSTWTGEDAISTVIADSGGLDAGPAPRISYYDVDGWREALVVVQTTGTCPMREARRWILRGDGDDMRIVEDIRYRHVPSVRRCALDDELEPDDAWWSTFDPDPDDLGVTNLKTSIGGRVVEVINAEPEEMRFVRWAIERYELGLDVPEVDAIWFPPSPDCPGEGSFARREDDRYGGGHSVTFCLTDADLRSARAQQPFAAVAARLALHELAHVWMYDHLTDDQRAEFIEWVSVEVWRAADHPWGDQGVELAAETIAWGLSGDAYAVYEIEPRPSCAELHDRFVFLTGRPPLTTCPGVGDG